MERAVSLLRVSGASQVDGHGPERQRQTVKAFADSKAFEVVDEVFDGSQSGSAAFTDRADLFYAMARCQQLDATVIVVENATRLSRDSVQNELAIREFQNCGIRVFSADCGTELTQGDAESPTAKLIRQILSSVSEWEKDTIVIKLRAARMAKRQDNGKCEGQKAYGETYESEDPVRATILQLRKAGKTYQQIANKLNTEGVPTRRRKWQMHTVRHLEHTPVTKLNGHQKQLKNRIAVLKQSGMSDLEVAELFNADGVSSGRTSRWHASTVRNICQRG